MAAANASARGQRAAILGSPLHELTSFYLAQRQRGRYLGGEAPWGWKVRDAGDLLPEPAKRTALKQMRKLRAEGASLRAISNNIKAAGVSITHQGVKSALAAADRPAADGSCP
jgi:hypothetical protein